MNLSQKSGRNMPVAVATGIALMCIILLPLLCAPELFALVVAVFAGLGAYELATVLNARREAGLPALVLGGVAFIFCMLGHFPHYWLFFSILAVVTAVVNFPVLKEKMPAAVAYGFAIMVYVPGLLGFANVLVQKPWGKEAIILALLLVVSSDTGGLFAGMAFGKHKLAPSISPGKTREGSVGSLILATIVGMICVARFSPLPWYWGAIAAACLVVAATCGDLFESKIKRTLEIKDMSHMIPGHGGVMDRLDSIVFALPVMYILFTLVTHLGLLG